MELTGEPIPAVARLGNLPDFGVSGVPGLKTDETWVKEDLRGTRDPLVALARLEGA